MNIFYLDKDPVKCAQYHCDKHVVKMVLEYCQLLSSAHRVLDGHLVDGTRRYHLPDWREDKLYHVTHINHPSTIWARTNRSNYEWLYSLLVALNDEYVFRYLKTHKSSADGIISALSLAPNSITIDEFFQPTQAMPDSYKVQGDSIAAYRAFYLVEKSGFLKWKNRPIPDWVLQSQ